MDNLEKDFDFFKKNVEKEEIKQTNNNKDNSPDLSEGVLIEFSKGISFIVSFYFPLIALFLCLTMFSPDFKQENALSFLQLLGKNFFPIVLILNIVIDFIKIPFAKKISLNSFLSPIKYAAIFVASNSIYNMIESIFRTFWSNF